MNNFQVIEKIFQGMVIIAIHAYRKESKHVPYQSIVWMVRILFTLLLPLIFIVVFFKIIKGLITDEDKEDAMRESGEMMVIHQNTSEFEYRYPHDVFWRILKNIPRVKDKYGESVPAYDLISIDKIAATFIALSGKLFETRLESKDEFVTRHLTGQESGSDIAVKLKDFYEQRYEITMEKCQGDTLKAYYMGIEILAIKKPIGNEKAPPPKQHLEPQPLIN